MIYVPPINFFFCEFHFGYHISGPDFPGNIGVIKTLICQAFPRDKSFVPDRFKLLGKKGGSQAINQESDQDGI
jgi:hypothetical protein